MRLDGILDRDQHPFAHQDLTGAGGVAQARREVRDRADRGVVRAPLETDPTDRREALRDPDPELKVVTEPLPVGGQLADAIPHRDPHPDGSQGRVVAWHRIVEEHHQAVTSEPLQGPFEVEDELSERGVVGAQDGHHVLGLAGLRESGETAQIAEDDGDLAPVAVEQRIVARGHDQVDQLGCEESLESSHPAQFVDLFADATLELGVPSLELRGLGLDPVAIALDADQ